MNNNQLYSASESWKRELSQPGSYEHHCLSLKDAKELQNLGRVWKRIFHLTNLKKNSRVFELGCGGGIHLGSLALNGFDAHGIDVSEDVANRAKNYLNEINQFIPISTSVEVADIFNYEGKQNNYDMCFHFGVVEHFLETAERQLIWNKLKNLTKPGGWIISVVPCGQNFMREVIREQRLCGYHVPEIDYSCGSHREEFERVGLSDIKTLSHNFFPFLAYHPSKLISKVIYPPLFLLGNVLIPSLPLPVEMTEKWAQTLIVIARKPN